MPPRKHGTYWMTSARPTMCGWASARGSVSTQIPRRATREGQRRKNKKKNGSNRYICISYGRLHSGPSITGLYVRFMVSNRLEPRCNGPGGKSYDRSSLAGGSTHAMTTVAIDNG